MRKHTQNGKVRTATVAGIFYPEDSAELAAELAFFLSGAEPIPRQVRAILSPHGGFSHSGALAAKAWKAAANMSPRRIVIVGPLHGDSEKGIFLPESSLFRTPLGDIRVSTADIAALRHCGTAFHLYDIPHMEEHSIELQLPFVQTLFPGIPIVPILLGKPDESTADALSAALEHVFGNSGRDVLFVVSSNLVPDRDAEIARSKSDAFARECKGGEWEKLLVQGCAGEGPCGGVALASLMRCGFMNRCAFLELGRGDSESVREFPDEDTVGYAAIAFVEEQ